MIATTDPAAPAPDPVVHSAAWMTISMGVVAAGLALGILTQVMQGHLPEPWSVLANSEVMWALAAFALGTAMPGARSAAIAGAIELVLASIIYYQAVEWFEGIDQSDARGALVWPLVSLVAGPVFGLAGHWFAQRPERRSVAMAIVAAALLHEGFRFIWVIRRGVLLPAAVVEIALAVVLIAVCLNRSIRDRDRAAVVQVLAVVLAATGLAMAAGTAIDGAFMIL